MKRIKIAFIAILLLATLAFIATLSPSERTFDLWALRKSLVYFTGFVAFGLMTAGVVLATRSRVIEAWLNGLDKHYRLHKWLGIAAAVFSCAHWLFKKAPKQLVSQGWVDAAVFKTPGGTEDFFGDANLLKPMEHLAKSLGEWAFYILLVMVVLALWKKFPYRYFFKTHRLLAVIYLILAFHSAVLFGELGWLSPAGILMALLLAVGVPAALKSVLQRIGHEHRATGMIESCSYHPDNGVLVVSIRLTMPWSDHQEGQFAFVMFERSEGPHPFTLSSPWRGDGLLTFHIKGLGDYTRALPHRIEPGDEVSVEGPYGKFQFDHARDHQIWVAGGIGITPFLSRLGALADVPWPQRRPISFFYSTREPDHAFIGEIRRLSELAGIAFHLTITGRDPALNAETICSLVPDYLDTEVWFCGPTGFGRGLRADLTGKGFPGDRFHQELFNMR